MTDRIPPPAFSGTATLSPSVALARRTTAAHAQAFAEAQRRLAARRRERAYAEAAARTAASSQPLRRRPERSDAVSGPLVQRLGRVTWDGVCQLVESAQQRWVGVGEQRLQQQPAFRVSQVDAELLDEELLDLLRGKVADAVRYVRGGTLTDDWAPEVELALRAALFKLSVWDHDATYGASLQNLRYADARHRADGIGTAAVPVPPARWQKALYGLVAVGGRYAWAKWEDWLRESEDTADDEEGLDELDELAMGEHRVLRLPVSLPRLPRLPRLSPKRVQQLSRVTTRVADVHAAAAFMSFLLFLRYGRYRTLLDRVLRMRLVPPTSQVRREVSFEYLNRQLVWHAFTEFLLFVLPLVGVHRWRRWLARTWRSARRAVATVVAAAVGVPTTSTENGTRDTDKLQGELAFLPERTCAICYEDENATTTEADLMAQAAASSGVIGSAETDITNPYEATPCGCIYCYVCLATRIEREEGDGWTCLRCRAVVTACRPWNGDVLEPLTTEDGARLPSDIADVRPSSSSTVTSSGSAAAHPHKTVGFADDVKGDEDENEQSVLLQDNDDCMHSVPDAVRDNSPEESDPDSEAYDQEEDDLDEAD